MVTVVATTKKRTVFRNDRLTRLPEMDVDSESQDYLEVGLRVDKFGVSGMV